jgi:hypothetical protein
MDRCAWACAALSYCIFAYTAVNAVRVTQAAMAFRCISCRACRRGRCASDRRRVRPCAYRRGRCAGIWRRARRCGRACGACCGCGCGAGRCARAWLSSPSWLLSCSRSASPFASHALVASVFVVVVVARATMYHGREGRRASGRRARAQVHLGDRAPLAAPLVAALALGVALVSLVAALVGAVVGSSLFPSCCLSCASSRASFRADCRTRRAHADRALRTLPVVLGAVCAPAGLLADRHASGETVRVEFAQPCLQSISCHWGSLRTGRGSPPPC